MGSRSKTVNMVFSDSEEDEIVACSSRKRNSFQKLESSTSEEEEAKHKQLQKRRRIESETDSDGDDYLQKPSCSSSFVEKTPRKKKMYIAESSDDNSCEEILNTKNTQSIKYQRRTKLEQMARKKNPKYQSNHNPNQSETENDDDESAYELDEKTRVFITKFNNICDLSSCNKKLIQNVTKIMGVQIFDENLGKYTGKTSLSGKETNYWVCASHSKFWQDSSDKDDANKYESESNEDTDDDNFIDDEEVEDNEEHEENEDGENSEGVEDDVDNPKIDMSDSIDFQEILKGLSRSTDTDKENKDRYIEEHSKYQLEIHSETNRGLYLNPGKRFKRNMNVANFDKGLKDDG